MLKKKKSFKVKLQYLFSTLQPVLVLGVYFSTLKGWALLKNIFRITTSYKQLFFSLLDTSTKFTKLYSTGQILINQVRKFKFFKKSPFNVNPLVFTLRFSYVHFFRNLYLMESLNYSKKQYQFFKKLINSIQTKLKFILFKKTWEYTTKPVKRIKRRVLRLIKNS